MPAPSNDRRISRSQDALRKALGALLPERGYERLTIQNILDRAGVGRATFYAHFDNKDALLACSMEHMRVWLQQQALSAAGGNAHSAPRLGFTLAYFQHVAGHRRMYETCIVPEGEHTVERYSRALLKALVREDLLSRPEGRRIPSASLEVAAQYVSAALFSVVLWWLEHKQPLTPLELNNLFQQLTFPGLEVVLGATEPTGPSARTWSEQ